ncbi:MAG: serine/threonine-protein phosphatase [Sulfobacillus thermosulfidooxidans]|uniref:Serine/threonine protein phosphatase n=1 Tax=Sulfobacillus thermotolerans TaxID=338644 RepID=A0ABN5H325_9FIRM|nr:PP2C family serine/threonine-protein phosphatase [Sulfobacillus sp. hq2]AUW94476.1 serine/threonine protein phosphatase [Sulfobacillus thermotolerans]MCY0908214.1 protein phosphatase 2C domain-containing protein [Sulfobacillus thermotolerans]POB09229.1 serine/threonine protein phosphatase [Sulfobacillus sp. hq2]PSR37188.1 MAG: serine/threonine-protein phosphatase [Sulfobacillus thermosulfidooxidans]
MKTFGRSDQGLVRSENQDDFLIRPVENGGYLVAVADGIGGGPAGRRASHLALTTLDNAVGLLVSDVSRLTSAFSLANRTIFAMGQDNPVLEGMGTTLTAAVLYPDRLLLAHVGDSRAYRIAQDQIIRLTMDHSVAGEMERAGTITAQEASEHPKRHVLTRALGPFDKVRVDVADMPWTPGDLLLLCTDGLTSVVPDEEILRMCMAYSGEDLIDHLIGGALGRGGPDNVTVVVAVDNAGAGETDGR